MTHVVVLAALLVAAVPQAAPIATPSTQQTGGRGVAGPAAPSQDGPPIIDMALRTVRASSGGSSAARTAARGAEPGVVYSGLGPCIVGASANDPAVENSITWRASGVVRSVDRGIAIADVEWQRVEYRPAGVTAGPRVRMTLTLPLGERVAVDALETPGSICRMDGLVFEIGVAPDHGRRLAMSGEGRAQTSVAASASAGRTAGGGSAGTGGGGAGATGSGLSGSSGSVGGSGGSGVGGGGMGRRLTPAEIEAQAERARQGAEAARSAPVVTRPMPPRQYTVDAWLVPAAATSAASPLAQRMSQVIGGTGGRFAFPPVPFEASGRSGAVEISALAIPVNGEQLMVAITRHVAPADGAPPVTSGWIKTVQLKPGEIFSFEIPAPDASEPAIVPRQAFGLRLRVERQ